MRRSCTNNMNNLGHPDQDSFEHDEIFDDSTFLANFDNVSFKQAKAPSGNVDLCDKTALNVSALCCDEEISGYDKLTGQTWIYPTNYPVRDYQFNIIKAAILKNTLVSLPTGLGKTFIAAVIMYNFYRWYPLGKILFTAPTRPLVAQQIDACYNIIAIPPNDTIEMTGHMQVNTRKAHWQNKRVFFATPQVIYNDIKSGICPAEKIRCLVIDEAHRARGNYAYCQIVSTLDELGHKTYRMLALSATPGSKVDDVINVVKSLHIAHLELRTENCIDVAPYSHSRKISTVVVQLGPELSQLRQHYVEILDGYARRLKQFNILPQNLGNLSKGRIVMLYKEYQTKDRGQRHAQHNYIMKDFTILIALYHGLELLMKHGSRVFLNFFDEHPEKGWIQADDRLTALLERLRDDLGVNPLSLDRSILPDGTIPEMPKNLCFGHPKFDKLKSIIMDHFTTAKQKNQDTRAIIFCEYRESVNLVHCLLLQCRPLISPQMFVGQGASGKDGKTVVSQKQQLRVMRSFREGQCNTLVATCVAEEGLDVGSVDLIVCFDVSTRSPIRLVQRCGRTGRERGGQVHILVTEGREHQTLIDCMRQRDGLNKKILQSRDVENNLYKANPRMMPHGFTPNCQKMFITVDKTAKDVAEKSTKKGQKDLRCMLLTNRASSSSASSSSKEDATSYITEDDFRKQFPQGYRQKTLFKAPINHWEMSKETLKTQALLSIEHEECLNLNKWLEWQRTLQKTVNIGHTKDSEFLSSILQKCDAKRLGSSQNEAMNAQNIATQNIGVKTQSPLKTQQSPLKALQFPLKPPQSPLKTNKQARKKQKTQAKSPAKNNGDIRALFNTATKSTKSYTKLINDLGIQNDGGISTKLLNLLVDLNLNVDKSSDSKQCYICKHICDCKTMNVLRKTNKPATLSKFPTDVVLPDVHLIDEISAEVIISCRKDSEVNRSTLHSEDENVTIGKNHKANCSNFDLELDLEAFEEIESPKPAIENTEISVTSEKNFDLGDIDDIFADSSPEEAINKNLQEVVAEKVNEDKSKPTETHEALGFFGLDSIDDIFAESDDDVIPISPNTASNRDDFDCTVKDKRIDKSEIKDSTNFKEKSKETKNIPKLEPLKSDNVPNSAYPLSPSILTGKQVLNEIPTSPILCSQTRRFQLSTKKKRLQSSTPNSSSAKKKLLLPQPDDDEVIVNDNFDEKTKFKSATDTTDKSMFTITQIMDMINKSKNISLNQTVKTLVKEKERSVSPIILTQADKKSFTKPINSKIKTKETNNNTRESLIILDSDSDSDNTESYDLDNEISKIDTNVTDLNILQNSSQIGGSKRKLDCDESLLTASPYFNKKQKINDIQEKPLTLQEKVLAAITSNKEKEAVENNGKNINNQAYFHISVSQPNIFSQKENRNPLDAFIKVADDEKKEKITPVEMLQTFRKENKLQTLRSKFDSIFKKSPKKTIEFPKAHFDESKDTTIEDRLHSPKLIIGRNDNKDPSAIKRKICFEDSDDDFVNNDKNSSHSPNVEDKRKEIKSTTNHKVRKKKRKHNSFVELEASLSDDGADSGDELTDDSAGSIVDFICDDEDVSRRDIQAVYLKSIRSPIKKNGFKIPELPQKYRREDIFSQFVEEDVYEMDSFCVDSHVGLTQVNDDSELELAEIVLKEKRKAKKRGNKPPNLSPPRTQNGDSPVIKRFNKKCKRRIHSDSEDSS